jgi:beta-lactamase regulating signal transducer with metallopeptidase domain
VETLLHEGTSNAVSATVLALVVACLARLLARRPAVLHCLWLLVLVKLVTPPLYEVPIPLPAALLAAPEPARAPVLLRSELSEGDLAYLLAPGREAANPEITAGEIAIESIGAPDGRSPARETHAAGARFSIDWMRLLVLVWLAGSVATLVVSAIRIRRFQRLLRGAQPAEPELQEWVHDLSLDLGLGRPPTIWWVEGRLSPFVWALDLRPRVIIPIKLWKSLDDRQRTTLIVHELAHLRRGDHYVRIFELIVTALYWWHPVLWWVRQALRDAEEQCCDAWVVWAFPEAAKSYAEALLETLDFLDQCRYRAPLMASGFGKVHHLRRRLTMIMSGTTPRLLGLSGALGALGLAALLLPVNATWGQQVEKQEVRVVVDPTAADESVAVIELKPEMLPIRSEALRIVDGSSPDVVRVEVKTNDESTTVEADSIEQAIQRLKALIEEQGRKPSLSDQEKAQLKALERVVKELGLIAKKIKTGGADKQTWQGTKRFTVVRRIDEINDEKLSKEKRAEIDKARAKVKELSQSLRSMQKQLMEAQHKLAQLEGRSPFTRSFVFGSDDPGKPIASYRWVAPQRDKTPPRPGIGIGVGSGESSNAKRLSELEKKLDKLREEVATLKKDREKAGR